jgi:hypothetical protein
LRSIASITGVSIDSTSASQTVSETVRRWAIIRRCSMPPWRMQSIRSVSHSDRQFSSRSRATWKTSRSKSRDRAGGGSLRVAKRWATRARSATEASRSISTSRSAVIARSKALTLLDGRQTTSAMRLSRAVRALDGRGAGGAASLVSERGSMSLIVSA